MATTINSGLIDTADPTSNQLKVDMSEKIAMLDPDVSQFTTILSKLPKDRANSFKTEWLDDRLIPRTSALAASATSADTALTVTTSEGAYFKVGDLVRITTTGECVRVTATAASALTVVRAVGTVTAASAASSSTAGQLVIVGGSNAQGATLPTALVTATTANYNYTSITRNAWRYTETALATGWYGGSLGARESKKKASEHKADLENTAFFGARSYSTSDPPRHTAGGLIEYVTTNVTDPSGTLDKGELNDFMLSGLQYGSKNKVLFAAPVVAMVISEFLQDNWVRTQPDERVWGAKVDAYISGVYGTSIPVIVKQQWGAYGTGTSGQYGSRAVLVDLDHVALAPLRDTMLLTKRQANDADEQAAEFLTEQSLIVRQESSHAWLKNVTG